MFGTIHILPFLRSGPRQVGQFSQRGSQALEAEILEIYRQYFIVILDPAFQHGTFSPSGMIDTVPNLVFGFDDRNGFHRSRQSQVGDNTVGN